MTCVKSSQGFDWNQGNQGSKTRKHLAPANHLPPYPELFLPSYADYDSQELEHKPDPIEDIILTDEEAAAMMPQ